MCSTMENQLSVRQVRRLTAAPFQAMHERVVASAYNQAGDGYISYADGDPAKLFCFDGHYGYGDRCIWTLLDAKLGQLRASGSRSIRVLDLGCGPGTWLRRVVTRAHELGFSEIVARGFDIAGGQVRRARELSGSITGLPGVSLTFAVRDIFDQFSERNLSVDLCLCLCGVLNHLPAAALPAIVGEIARVTRGCFVTTARAVGSTPSVYVDTIEQARRFRQDNRADRLDVEFQDGHRISLPSHLFSASELREMVASRLHIEDLRGLDLFHGRFASDPRWNPDCGSGAQFAGELDQLEEAYCRDEKFIDHATHLLLVANRDPLTSDLARTRKSIRRESEARRGYFGSEFGNDHA
jgi:SAM-dependent methyltransferase